MRQKVILRIAAGIMVLHAIGHLFGMSQWANSKTDEQNQVVHAMTDHRFPFMGAVHSYADSFNGFGYSAEIALLLIAYLMWFTASLVDSQPGISKRLSLALCIVLFPHALLEFIFFFPLAASMTFLSAILVGIAFFSE